MIEHFESITSPSLSLSYHVDYHLKRCLERDKETSINKPNKNIV